MERPSRSEAEQQAFFEAVWERARDALAAAGAVRRTLDLGGYRVRLSFAGGRLVPLLAVALAHLELADDEGAVHAELTIWDSELTGLSMIESPFRKLDFTTRGDIRGFDSRRFRTAFHWYDSSVNVFDTGTSRGVFWVESASRLPYWVHAVPLRTLLSWFVESFGGELVHGAAVGTDEGAILLVGERGVGKSRAALAALARGFRYLGDEHVVVRRYPRLAVQCLYSSARISREELARWPELARCELAEAPDGSAVVLALGDHLRSRGKLELPLCALALAVPESRRGAPLVVLEPAAVERRMTFSALERLPGAGEHACAVAVELAAKLPAYELPLSEVPAAVAELVSASGARGISSVPAVSSRTAELPPVSVIVPSFNGARFLTEAIDSVLEQEYPALEIVVVDDASSDETRELVARLPVRVRYLRNEHRVGPAESRNRGGRAAVHDLVAFLDVDDLWPRHNLVRLVTHLLEHPELDVIRGYAQLLELDRASGCYRLRGGPRDAFQFYVGAGLYRRRVFDSVGGFDPELEFSEDVDWYQRASELGRRIETIEEIALYVRRHGDNMTSGKTLVELNTLRVVKMARDRRRSRAPKEAQARLRASAARITEK